MKRFLMFALIFMLLSGCSQITDPSPGESLPADEPSLTTEPQLPTDATSESLTEPPTQPTISEETQMMAALGFEPLAQENYYLYTGTDHVIPLPETELLLTLPEDWMDKIYVVIDLNHYYEASARLHVVGRDLLHARWDLIEPTKEDILNISQWDIYMFRLYERKKENYTPIKDGQYHCTCQRDTILAEHGSMFVITERQVLCQSCMFSMDYLPRGALSGRLGADVYEAVGGNWMPTVDEIRSMVSIAP